MKAVGVQYGLGDCCRLLVRVIDVNRVIADGKEGPNPVFSVSVRSRIPAREENEIDR